MMVIGPATMKPCKECWLNRWKTAVIFVSCLDIAPDGEAVERAEYNRNVCVFCLLVMQLIKCVYFCGRGGMLKSTKKPDLKQAGLKLGSSGRTRTADKVVNSHPLYQLSYRGTQLMTVFAAYLLVPLYKRV